MSVCVYMCGGIIIHVHHLSAGEGLHICAGEWGVTVCGTCWCELRYVQAFEWYVKHKHMLGVCVCVCVYALCSCIACIFLFTCIHVQTPLKLHVCVCVCARIISHLFKVTALNVQGRVIMCVHIWPWHVLLCTYVSLVIWGANRYT